MNYAKQTNNTIFLSTLLVVGVLLVTLFFLNMRTSIAFSYQPNTDQAYVARMAPHERVMENAFVHVLAEPVYIDVDLPRDFRVLVLSGMFLASQNVEFRIGAVADEFGNMNFYPVDVADTRELQEFTLTIPADEVLQSDGRMRLLISAPGLSDQDILALNTLRFEFDMGPMQIRYFVDQVFERFYAGHNNFF